MIRRSFILCFAAIVTLSGFPASILCGPNGLPAAEPDGDSAGLAVQANSDFAFDVYQQLAKDNADENLFFSPYSISIALAMTAEGARGKTAAEMGRVLRFPDAVRRDDDQSLPWAMARIHTGVAELNRVLGSGEEDPQQTAEIREQIAALREQFEAAQQQTAQLQQQRKWRESMASRKMEEKLGAQLNKLSSQVDQYELRVANALWGEQTYPFREEYTDTIAKHYGTGGVVPVDFINNFPAARLRINGWVENQTNDRIKDIIPDLPPDQAKLLRLILTNAIYFKGEWSEPFKAEQTKDRDFTLAAGSPVQTPIMNARELEVARYAAFNADGSLFNTPRAIRHGQKDGLYPGADGFAMVELPYKGEDLSMVVIAPNKPDGLPALEGKLTAANLNAWVGQLQKRKTHIFLPKFKMETKYTMNETLQAMGMVRAFTDPRLPGGADFTGMCASDDPRYRLYISKVLHKAFVEVNEKGTEAAAATAVLMAGTTSMPVTVPFTPTFKADRPFVFLIREKSTGSVLFLGRMVNPAA